MSNPLLTELNALLHETDLLLVCSDLNTDLLESYGRKRLEIFSHLENRKNSKMHGETELLREVLLRIQAQDERLLKQLERYRSMCREELLTIARARKMMKDGEPSLLGHLLERLI